MKKAFTIIPIIMTLMVFQLQGQIFVKHDATGAADGSSWGNAYTDLEVAIAASSINDQIWVAAGTYKPGGDTVTSYFTLPHDLELYGGFVGTETSLSERDWMTNETILSGDHDGNDIDNIFSSNKEDNSLHVMWLTDTITVATIIDGLRIKYGNTLPATGSNNDRRGGGILSFGSPTIRNCFFEQNFGHFGGGFYARNEGARDFSFDNCTFKNNSSFNGAGLYNLSQAGKITNCIFESNDAENRGGGVFNRSSGATYINCEFTSNRAGFDAGGLFINNSLENPAPLNISDCVFFDNRCIEWAGAMAVFGSATVANIVDCSFESNSCGRNGGAILLGFESTTNLNNCAFMENDAPTGRGGAIHMITQNTRLNTKNCLFYSNNAEVGGAISNAGAIETLDSIPLMQINIEASRLQFNTSILQGGAMFVYNADCSLTNSVFDYNFVIDAEGVGGAIIYNTDDSIDAAYSLINCTVAYNEAAVGAGIGHWKEGTEGSSIVTLQNTILDNPSGSNYEVEQGDPDLVSNGGNLSSDNSLEAEFTNTNDLNNTDPIFVDTYNFDFGLQDSSPCIDAGVSAGAPLLDIEGNARVGEVDMGAYENQTMSSVHALAQVFGELNIFPNPVAKDLNFEFIDTEMTELKIQIFDAKGSSLSTQWINKESEIINQTIDVAHLTAGIYYLHISDGSRVNSKSFVKK